MKDKKILMTTNYDKIGKRISFYNYPDEWNNNKTFLFFTATERFAFFNYQLISKFEFLSILFLNYKNKI